MARTFAAVDLGNSSGRIMLGEVSDDALTISEVRRIPNAPILRPDGWHSNVRELWSSVLEGLRQAARQTDLAGIAIDTWGVDYGLFNGTGELIDEPFSYRDDRTLAMVGVAEGRMAPADLYRHTGCQTEPINTLYQLLADQASGRLQDADYFLLNPNLFAYWLSGVTGADETIASTTQLFDPRSRNWCWDAVDAMRLPRSLFAPVKRTGTVLGHVRSGFDLPTDVPVITAAGHDTAAAFVAATGDPDQLVISIGTWSLVGVELTSPLISDAGRAANFTNEIGVLGTIRFLRNAVGLWLIQECLREWRDLGSAMAWDDLITAAERATPFASLFFSDDRRFMEPGPMADRIVAAADGVPVDDHGGIVRSILESLSLNHRLLLETVQSVTGRSLSRIRIVGGGAQNRLLCQMTADATGLPVVAGPAEATAIGNIAMQAIAIGQVKDLAAARELIDRSFPPTRYDPAQDRQQWDDAYTRWRALA